MPEHLTVIFTEPLASILDLPLTCAEIPPGGSLRVGIVDTIYVFQWDADTNTVRVHMQKPDALDLPLNRLQDATERP